MVKLNPKIKKLLIVFLIFTVVFLLNLDNLDPSASLTYPIKRFQEKVFLTLKFGSSAKAGYYQVLLGNRLIELESLAKNNQEKYIASAALRYSTTAGDLTNLVKENNLNGQVGPVLDQFKDHQTRLRAAHDKMFNKFGVLETLDQRKQIQTSMDALAIYSQTLYSLK